MIESFQHTAQSWLSMQGDYHLAQIKAKADAIKVSVLPRNPRLGAA
jgi:hypothetical protein